MTLTRSHPPACYANLYKTHNLTGGHVIKLGPRNDTAAREALAAWPEGLQVGGGINVDNALEWLEAGASKVIVTSWLFPDGKLDRSRLEKLEGLVGKERLVVDLRWVLLQIAVLWRAEVVRGAVSDGRRR